MLVLSRRNGEAVQIGPDIRIRVVSVSGNRVRLSIEAPPEVGVHREEVYRRIEAANREASCPDPEVLRQVSDLAEPCESEGAA